MSQPISNLHFLLLIVLTLVFVQNVFCDDKETADLNKVICGPRCVQYLLKYFGTETDLIELVREMQWPQLTEGASAASMIESLEKRNVYVKPIEVDPASAVFVWKYPIILHLKPDSENSLGHFVVWLPESTDHDIVLYDGLAGFRAESRQSLSKKMSGVAILTSPESIQSDAVAVYHSIALWHWGLGLAAILIGLGCWKRNREKRKPIGSVNFL